MNKKIKFDSCDTLPLFMCHPKFDFKCAYFSSSFDPVLEKKILF